jgi:hypothetical protein
MASGLGLLVLLSPSFRNRPRDGFLIRAEAQVFANRLDGGIYSMDEPEPALSRERAATSFAIPCSIGGSCATDRTRTNGPRSKRRVRQHDL